MKMLRTLVVVMAVAVVVACGGAPAESPSDVETADGAPQPTAVFSDDFETGEVEDWQAEEEEVGDEKPDGAEAQTE